MEVNREIHMTQSNQTNDETTDETTIHPDPDLYDLIPTFLQNRKDESRDLEKALAKRDFEQIRRIAHTWKGICRPYGFMHLEKLSLRLEAAGQQENLADAQDVFEQIKHHLANVKIIAP